MYNIRQFFNVEIRTNLIREGNQHALIWYNKFFSFNPYLVLVTTIIINASLGSIWKRMTIKLISISSLTFSYNVLWNKTDLA